jgi:hypothetical protein
MIQPSDVSLRRAIDEWSELLGAEHVTRAAAALDPSRRTTFRTSQQAIAAILPGSCAELAGAVRIADAHRVPL